MGCLLSQRVPNCLVSETSCMLRHEGCITTLFFHHACLLGPRSETSLLGFTVDLCPVDWHYSVSYEIDRSGAFWTCAYFSPFFACIVQRLCMPVGDLLIRAWKRAWLLILPSAEGFIGCPSPSTCLIPLSAGKVRLRIWLITIKSRAAAGLRAVLKVDACFM